MLVSAFGNFYEVDQDNEFNARLIAFVFATRRKPADDAELQAFTKSYVVESRSKDM